MHILIQKFGGTSVKNVESRRHVINKITDALKQYDKLIVVVSAIGRKPSPYATDSLLSLVDFPETSSSNRELDLLMSCGETIAAVILSHELKKNNVSAIALTGSQAGFTTNDDFNQARIKEVNPNRIIKEFKEHDIIVVAGCQGETETGEITTIGRGGSDTTAVALGASLQAKRIEIFTDVNGIMTADPEIVESVKLIKVVSYEEICNLAYQGAKVIHPHAVELAMQANIPLRIRSTYTKSKGTLVVPSKEDFIEANRIITGITHIPAITQINIPIEERSNNQSEVFKAMADAEISVDFIYISPTHISYTVPNFKVSKAVHILEALGLEPEITENCAKISIVGAGMTGVPGVASRIVMSLIESGVQILQSADSYTTIWILVHEKDLKSAINALHDEFELSNI